MMKALALISGGLDSSLAAKIIQNQGVEVVGLHFHIPFSKGKREVFSSLGIEIQDIDIKEKFLELIRNPSHGFGSNMNPCIDCKILMLKEAKGLMKELGADFIISGEVLGQRPMSQNLRALELIERESGLEGLLLRPLCATLLAPTEPEKQGWVERQKLLGFSGRSRRPQMALAKEMNIQGYGTPAGGCLLTDPEFSKRLKELIAHQEFNMENIELLKVGRHFRLAPHTKLAVGRNEKENAQLLRLVKDGDYLFYPNEELAGPTALGRGFFNEELIKISCRITSRYCDLNENTRADVLYKRIPEQQEEASKVLSLPDAEATSFRI